MTKEEAKEFLIDTSYKFGNMSVEYLTEKDGKKMREAIKALEREPLTDKEQRIFLAAMSKDAGVLRRRRKKHYGDDKKRSNKNIKK